MNPWNAVTQEDGSPAPWMFRMMAMATWPQPGSLVRLDRDARFIGEEQDAPYQRACLLGDRVFQLAGIEMSGNGTAVLKELDDAGQPTDVTRRHPADWFKDAAPGEVVQAVLLRNEDRWWLIPYGADPGDAHGIGAAWPVAEPVDPRGAAALLVGTGREETAFEEGIRPLSELAMAGTFRILHRDAGGIGVIDIIGYDPAGIESRAREILRFLGKARIGEALALERELPAGPLQAAEMRRIMEPASDSEGCYGILVGDWGGTPAFLPLTAGRLESAQQPILLNPTLSRAVRLNFGYQDTMASWAARRLPAARRHIAGNGTDTDFWEMVKRNTGFLGSFILRSDGHGGHLLDLNPATFWMTPLGDPELDYVNQLRSPEPPDMDHRGGTEGTVAGKEMTA